MDNHILGTVMLGGCKSKLVFLVEVKFSWDSFFFWLSLLHLCSVLSAYYSSFFVSHMLLWLWRQGWRRAIETLFSQVWWSVESFLRLHVERSRNAWQNIWEMRRKFLSFALFLSSSMRSWSAPSSPLFSLNQEKRFFFRTQPYFLFYFRSEKIRELLRPNLIVTI